MNAVRKLVDQVMEQTQYTPLISNLLLTDGNALSSIISESKDVIADRMVSQEDKDRAKARIVMAHSIYDKLLQMTDDYLSITVQNIIEPTPNTNIQSVHTVEPISEEIVEEQQEAKEIKFIPKTNKKEKINKTKNIDKIQAEIKEERLIEKHPALREEFKEEKLSDSYKESFIKDISEAKTIGDLDIACRKDRLENPDRSILLLKSYYLEIIATKDLSNNNSTLKESFDRLRLNRDAQIIRFYTQIENYVPRVKDNKKKVISRITLSEVCAKTKELVEAGNSKEAYAFAELNLRKIGTLRDDDNTKVIPHKSSDDFAKWFAEFDATYIPESKIKPLNQEKVEIERAEQVTPIEPEVVIEESPFKDMVDYSTLVNTAMKLIYEDKIEEARTYAYTQAVEKGMFPFNGIGDPRKWSEDSFNVMFTSLLKNHAKDPNSTIVTQITKELEEKTTAAVKEAIINNKPTNTVFKKVLDSCNAILDAASQVRLYKFAKKTATEELNPVVIDATTDIKKESNLETITDATIFVRHPFSVSHPELSKKYDKVNKLESVIKCGIHLEKTLGFQVALNAVYDFIESGKVTDAKDWTSIQIDDFYNKFILSTNNKTVEDKRETACPNHDSTEEVKTNNVVLIKDQKAMMETALNLLIAGNEADCAETVYLFQNHKRFNDKWSEQIMNELRKKARKSINKNK